MFKSKKKQPMEKLREQFEYNLSRLPKHWRESVLKKYAVILKKDGLYQANYYLDDLVRPLENLLNIVHDDDDIKALSKELAFKVRERGGFSQYQFDDYVGELCMAYSVRWPDEFDAGQRLARFQDDIWWLRNLRNSHARAREVAAINANIVHKKANIYCSDDTLDRRGQQLKRNAQTLANITMQSESGERMSLKACADAGMANPDNRRAELMTRINGFEELANEYGHKAVFVTITCPSRMHAVLATGKPNPKYDGTKPDEAQRYLVECWARARAKLARQQVKFYGLRVAEPHHDATPHWHMIFFFKDDHKNNLVDAIKFEFMRDSWHEAGAQQNRVKFVHINPLKGTAAGYVVKYVSKNIGGIEGEKSDEANADSKSLAGRVEAWAATWRIRQFQQVGGHSVTVWRELRRVASECAFKASDNIFKAWQCAQKTVELKASFAKYIQAMGGLDVRPRESVLALDDDYIHTKGKYGDTVIRVIKGVRERWGLGVANNNREKWERV